MTDQVSPSFSWLTAMGHTAAIVGAVFVVSLGFAVAGTVDATKTGGFAASLMFPAILLGAWWSYSVQMRQTGTKQVLSVLLVVLFLYEIIFLAAASRAGSRQVPPLTAEEQAPPQQVRTDDGFVLCQQKIGLRLPVVGCTLTLAPELAERLKTQAPRERFAQWVYRAEGGGVVVVMAAKGFETEESLVNFAEGFEQSAAAVKELTRPSRTITWDGSTGSVVLTTSLPDGVKTKMRCVSSPRGTLGCVQVVGTEIEKFEPLLSEFSLNKCLL